MRTFLLDVSAWDLVVDAAGDIAAASDPYALAQDAASAIRLFLGEQWFDTATGVPYFERILSKQPPLPLMKQLFVDAALTVPGVVAAQCFISGITARGVAGQVQVTDRAGAIAAASF